MHLAAGDISEKSSDAMNGSQFHQTAKSIADHLGGGVVKAGLVQGPTYTIQTKDFDTVSGTFAAVDSNITMLSDKIASLGNNGTDSKYFNASSTGMESQAQGADSIAVGPASVAQGDGSIAIGSDAQGSAKGAVALGENAKAVGENDVALGTGATTGGTFATSGTVIKGKQYGFAGGAPIGTLSIGKKDAERTITNVAAGRLSETSTDAVNGSQLHATNLAVDGITEKVVRVDENAVKYDANPDGTKANSISLQGSDPNKPVMLSNVATGERDDQAANVGQVKAKVKAAVDRTKEQFRVETESFKTALVQDIQTQSVQTLGRANAYTDNKFNQLNSDIGGLRREVAGVRKEARQAAAIGIAASSLRYDDRPGKLSAAISGGHWRGESAFSMGIGYTNQSANLRTNISATTSGGHWGVGAGLSITLN